MVNPHALTPFLVSVSLAAVTAVCARSHHRTSDDEDVFTISPAVGYLMAGGGLVFLAVPFLPGLSGDMSPALFFLAFALFSGLAFALAMYFFRYQVVVKDQTMTVGAFRRRTIQFSDVIDWDVIKGSRSSELWVYLPGGQRLKFSGLLSDFDELVGMVNSHMAGLPGPQHDSVAKIRDRAERQRNERGAAWITYIGLFIVAVAVFVLWRLHLLQ
jgi:hypothetical protein